MTASDTPDPLRRTLLDAADALDRGNQRVLALQLREWAAIPPSMTASDTPEQDDICGNVKGRFTCQLAPGHDGKHVCPNDDLSRVVEWYREEDEHGACYGAAVRHRARVLTNIETADMRAALTAARARIERLEGANESWKKECERILLGKMDMHDDRKVRIETLASALRSEIDWLRSTAWAQPYGRIRADSLQMALDAALAQPPAVAPDLDIAELARLSELRTEEPQTYAASDKAFQRGADSGEGQPGPLADVLYPSETLHDQVHTDGRLLASHPIHSAVLAAAECERSEGQPCPATAAHGVHECTLQAGHSGDHRWDFEVDEQPTAERVAAFVENLVSAPCSSRCLQTVADAIRREWSEGRSTPKAEDPRLRETCPTCDRPVADDQDWRDTQPGEGEWLCWGESQCRNNAVDWRTRCIVQSGLREAAVRERDHELARLAAICTVVEGHGAINEAEEHFDSAALQAVGRLFERLATAERRAEEWRDWALDIANNGANSVPVMSDAETREFIGRQLFDARVDCESFRRRAEAAEARLAEKSKP